ncbi:OmpH family outer membrane protein [Candidatus Mesenet endosymbiont of Agriotes lineatus]|uniref:OmpH family outer membrane protein n=1 Tax=Candidatus Mesenet endosymbiont of Agriotes lineatus TaxID=3077948 RepID=UPI0030CBC31B
MKRFLIFTIVVFLLFATEGICSNKDCVKFAIVDRDKILSESLAFQDMKKQADNEQAILQEDSSKKEEELHKTRQEISKQQDILSEEAFSQKMKEFNESVLKVQQDLSQKNMELRESYIAAVKEVLSEVKNIASNIAGEENIGLVLFVSKEEQVFYAKNEVDISDKTIKILNKEMPSIDIKAAHK